MGNAQTRSSMSRISGSESSQWKLDNSASGRHCNNSSSRGDDNAVGSAEEQSDRSDLEALNPVYHTLTRFLAGDNLEWVEESLTRQRILARSQGTLMVYAVPLQRLCSDLRGGSRRGGSKKDKNIELLPLSLASSMGVSGLSTELWRMLFHAILAVYMGKFEDAERSLTGLKEYKKQSFIPNLVLLQILFYEGIVAAVLATKSQFKSGGSSKWLRRKQLALAQRRLKKLQTEKERLGNSPSSCFLCNKLFLLDALIHATLGQHENALLLFHRSAELADGEGLLHEQGLAYELAGRMCLQCALETDAELYLSKAKTAYSQWGAHAKVSQIDRPM